MSNPVGSPSPSSVDATLLSTPTNTILNTVISPSVFYSHTRPVTPPQNLTASKPIGTPISNKTSGNHKHASKTHDRDSANLRLAEETAGLFLGAMPPKTFLDKFLPIFPGTPSCPEAKGTFKKVLSAERELQMYQPFITAIASFAGQLKFIDAHASPDTLRDKLTPDIGVYRHDNLPKEDAKTDFSKMELCVEVKFADTSDPFYDPEDPLHPQANDFRFEKDSDDARLVRGQLASYAAAHMGCQFRVHAFTVLICGKFARLIRWDRDGATVTRRFNYDQRPEVLADFFWRYAHLDRRQRGYDTSISLTSPDDIQRIQRVEKRLRDNNPAHREFCKIMVPDRSDPEVEKPFIISSPPTYTARSPFGRATRAMLAFDMEAEAIVFLKDYWRPDVDGMQKEGEIYALLESKGVPNIAPFGKGNDLRDYLTVTQALRSEKWACWSREMVLLRQYRMSLDVVGRHLTSFNSSHEFVRAIADAMEAHQHAYFDARILHRDVSVGNILITGEGRGLLIDWDLCMNLNNDRASARRPDRTGTWQFMSAALLHNNEKPHELVDDRESSLHVLTWTALRFTKHTNSEGDSIRFLRAFDEEYEGEHGVRGGDLKMGFLLSHKIPRSIKFDSRPQLDALIKELTEAFAVRYEEPPSAEEVKALKEAQAANLPLSIMAGLTAFKYQKRLDDLATPSWLVDTFKRHLDTGYWPPSDQAQGQPIAIGSSRKRAREQAKLELRIPRTKSQRLSDGSGSRSGLLVPPNDEMVD